MAISHFSSPDFAEVGAALLGNHAKCSAWQSHDSGVKASFADGHASLGNYLSVSAKLPVRNDNAMKVTALNGR